MKKAKHKPRAVLALTFGVLLFTGLALWLGRTEDVFVFPGERLTVSTYNEGGNSGNSRASSQISSSGEIEFEYTLDASHEEPFAAVYIKRDKSDQFFDVSQYNQIRLKISSLHAKRIPVTMTVDLEGFTSAELPLTNVPFTQIIELDEESGIYTLSINDFEIPSWWYRLHEKSEEFYEKASLSRVNYIVVGSCQYLKPGVRDKITVEEVVLRMNKSGYALFGSLFAGLIWGIGMVFIFYPKKGKVVIPVAATEFEARDQVGAVKEFVGLNYTNPELTTEDVALAVGVSTRQLSTLFKESIGVSFKEYLNQVRLLEVKRHLLQSDIPVSEIAYRCGYNNISHFNRVFKSAENVSPNEFRKNENRS